MAEGSARIDSPDVLKEFRKHVVAFEAACRNALMGVDADIRGTSDWLQGDRHSYWKHQLRRREEALTHALSELEHAKTTASLYGKGSCIEEKRAVEKAKRMKEEAERKIDIVRKWSLLLDQKASKLQGPCHALSSRLDLLVPRALARLDQMVVSLEEYLKISPEGSS